MSGTYDLRTVCYDATDCTDDFCFSSPMHFVPNLWGCDLDVLRTRFVLLASGEGALGGPGESWRMANVLGKPRASPTGSIPGARVATTTGRRGAAMLPQYLHELTSS